ncbi:hypothetical protein [Luethyella okanaganae]|uniref:hypothetical protein n=1 Tax=Luethyella okanaganae TaxID=69372 RepID=UPI0036DD2203
MSAPGKARTRHPASGSLTIVCSHPRTLGDTAEQGEVAFGRLAVPGFPSPSRESSLTREEAS